MKLINFLMPSEKSIPFIVSHKTINGVVIANGATGIFIEFIAPNIGNYIRIYGIMFRIANGLQTPYSFTFYGDGFQFLNNLQLPVAGLSSGPVLIHPIFAILRPNSYYKIEI